MLHIAAKVTPAPLFQAQDPQEMAWRRPSSMLSGKIPGEERKKIPPAPLAVTGLLPKKKIRFVMWARFASDEALQKRIGDFQRGVQKVATGMM
jgi:hypothetical protein